MEAALAWFGQLVEWIGRWIPRLQIVQADHAGVRWVCGKRVRRIDPGIMFYWPLVTNIHLTPTSRQTLNTPSQTITTKDGKTISVSLVFVFRVTDPIAALNRTYEYVDTIGDISHSTATETLSRHTYEWLSEHLTTAASAAILKKTRAELRKYGVTVESVSFVDFTLVRSLRIMGDRTRE